jgi:hypothetical protein
MPRLGAALHDRITESTRLALERYRPRPAQGGDAELARLVHAGSAHAFETIVERHWSAVAAYLSTCMDDSARADDLANHTFAHAFDAATNGVFPVGSWRLHLLTTARGLAVRAWAQEPSGPFSRGFHRWAATGCTWPVGGRSRLAAAYRMLSEHSKTALWHSIVEGEGRAATIACLGIRRDEFGPVTNQARASLRNAHRALHQRSTAAAVECTMYAPFLLASVEDGSVDRASARQRAREHIADHLADCPLCRETYEDLSDLDNQLRNQLPPLLLGWWPGSVYHTLRSMLPAPQQQPEYLRKAVHPGTPASRPRAARRSPQLARPLVLCLATAAVGTSVALGAHDALIRPAAEQRTDDEALTTDPTGGHSTTGIPLGRSGADTPSALARAAQSSPSMQPPNQPAKDPVPPPMTSPSPIQTDAQHQSHDTTVPIQAHEYALQQGTSPQTGGALALHSGGQLRFDNIDFGTAPKTLATIRLAAGSTSPPDARLTLHIDDSGAPDATLPVPASLKPQTLYVPLDEGRTGVHTLHIEATCPAPGPCVSLSSLSFS